MSETRLLYECDVPEYDEAGQLVKNPHNEQLFNNIVYMLFEDEVNVFRELDNLIKYKERGINLLNSRIQAYNNRLNLLRNAHFSQGLQETIKNLNEEIENCAKKISDIKALKENLKTKILYKNNYNLLLKAAKANFHTLLGKYICLSKEEKMGSKLPSDSELQSLMNKKINENEKSQKMSPYTQRIFQTTNSIQEKIDINFCSEDFPENLKPLGNQISASFRLVKALESSRTTVENDPSFYENKILSAGESLRMTREYISNDTLGRGRVIRDFKTDLQIIEEDPNPCARLLKRAWYAVVKIFFPEDVEKKKEESMRQRGHSDFLAPKGQDLIASLEGVERNLGIRF